MSWTESEKSNKFVQKIEKLILAMSEEEKNKWIISQAKLVSFGRQEDFYQSLTGEKKIQYMPRDEAIDKFCAQVEQAKIYLEYETHYVEFDSEGHYFDDWEEWYIDQSEAMSFLHDVLLGCHDLIRLGDYCHAYKILDQVCQLEFDVVEAKDSEDFDGVILPFGLADAFDKRLLHGRERVVQDLFEAFWHVHNKRKIDFLTEKLLAMLRLPICEKTMPSQVLPNKGTEKENSLYEQMILVLEKESIEEERLLNKASAQEWSLENYKRKQHVSRNRELVADLKGMM